MTTKPELNTPDKVVSGLPKTETNQESKLAQSELKLPNLSFEEQLFAEGYDYVLACDEVGRGAVAGPMAVGLAVITKTSSRNFPTKLRDSKLISAKVRQQLVPELDEWLAGSAVGYAEVSEIIELGLSPALTLAASRALNKLQQSFTELELDRAALILDGNFDYFSRGLELPLAKVVFYPKADQSSAVTAAASVLAKVDRDRLLQSLDQQFPDYGWAKNCGYGTAAHKAAVQSRGATVHHRLPWIQSWLANLEQN